MQWKVLIKISLFLSSQAQINGKKRLNKMTDNKA